MQMMPFGVYFWLHCVSKADRKMNLLEKGEQNHACATHIRMPSYVPTCINVTVDKYCKESPKLSDRSR